MISRDSWILTLAIAGAVVTYMLASPAPTEWVYQDWLKAAMFIVSTAAGKLATSPLPGQEAADVGEKAAEVVEAKRALESARNKNEPGG